MKTQQELTLAIRNEAFRLGFSDCGFSRVRKLSECEQTYESWIAKGHNGDMQYMERNIEKRIDPALLVENAKTVISFLFNYFPSESITGSPYKIAKYAYGDDYHEVLKAKLFQIDKFIRDNIHSDVSQRCFVDSAPVLERAWAQNSGLGWIGKNSCLVSRKHGSFVFIAEIITSLELDYDESIQDYCGTCRKCIDACPTQAITENRTIDSRSCISYQTIENKTEIPESLSGKFNNFIFGCDICQDICPWNKKSHPHTEPLFFLRKKTQDMSLSDWQLMNEEQYKEIFKKSAIKRTKYSGIKRNIAFVSS